MVPPCTAGWPAAGYQQKTSSSPPTFWKEMVLAAAWEMSAARATKLVKEACMMRRSCKLCLELLRKRWKTGNLLEKSEEGVKGSVSLD
jgi:hypothetical protein